MDLDNSTPKRIQDLDKAIQATIAYRTAIHLSGVDVCGLPEANRIHVYDVRMYVDMAYLTKAEFNSTLDDPYTTRLSFVYNGVTFYSIYTKEALAIPLKRGCDV